MLRVKIDLGYDFTEVSYTLTEFLTPYFSSAILKKMIALRLPTFKNETVDGFFKKIIRNPICE